MEIKLDCSKYLIKINKTEALKNLLDFKLGSAITEIVDAEYSIEMKAFLLLFNTSRETNQQLAKAYGQEIINKKYSLVSFTANSNAEYKDFLQQKFVIKKEFFQNILHHDNTYLISSFHLFQKFCAELSIQLPDNIRTSYYINFRENLSLEYQNNKGRYGDLVAFFSNPISLQNDKFAKLLDKYDSYKKNFISPLQKESESSETLQDLYVKPNFSVYKNNLVKILEDKSENFQTFSKNSTIHDYFEKYFLISNKNEKLKDNYDMVFVLGQPGQGKTSFCYKLLYDYLENNDDLPPIPIVFIKIRDLVAQDFIRSPFEEISRQFGILNFDSDELILILDGLDEAFMSGGISDSDLRNLYERLKKRSNNGIRIILTSRFNYLSVTDSCLDNTLVLQLDELSDKKIIEYCTNFGKFYPNNTLTKDAHKIVSEEKYSHIKELLRQAVLIYFVGISNISIDRKDSKSNIYDKIFDAMAQRSWDKSNGQLDYIHPSMKDKPEKYKKYLRDYLCNLAFEIHQSPNLYITLKELSALNSTKTFINKCFQASLFESPEKIKEVNKYLLISFYFQEAKNENNGDTAIEFFHNSLFEYLTAEYFWKENKKFLLAPDEDGELQNINYEDYFILIDKLVGQKLISNSTIERNLIEIIENDSYINRKNVFEQSRKIFSDGLNDDFLLKFDKKDNLLTAQQKIVQLYSLFWHFLHSSNKEMKVRFKLPQKISKYLRNSQISLSDLVNMEICGGNFLDNFYMHYGLILNTYFKSCLLNIYIYETKVKDSVFESITFIDFSFQESIFENVIFKNSDFDDSRRLLVKNKFRNCQFDNVAIKDEEWFAQLVAGNDFDKLTLDRHEIEMRTEKNHNGIDNINYYIVLKP